MVLNAQQELVVHELDRNLLLVASAGTGKTNTLAYRVAHILDTERARADQILCMTFTNKACREMKDRILSLVGQAAKAVEVSTFHSFCFKVLTEEAKRNEELYTDLTIFDEEDCQELFLPYKPASIKAARFGNLLGAIKEGRSLYGFYTEDLRADYEKTIQVMDQDPKGPLKAYFTDFDGQLYLGDYQDFLAHGADWLAAYDQALRNVHGLDFMDLITGVHRLFQDPAVRQRWRDRYRYIAVDEMQDTGTLEYRVMKVLWEGNRVLLCGDYFQTIYEWRGSDPFHILEDYVEQFDPVKVTFYDNYRANKTLFLAAFKTLEAMFPQEVATIYDKMPQSASPKGGKPILVEACRNEYEEAKFIYDAIRALPREDTIGVLVRDNRKAIRLSNLFERFNRDYPEADQRPFMNIDEFKFYRRQEIKDVMAYFKLIMNPNDAVSARRIIKRYVAGIGQARLKELESPRVRQAGLKLTDFMDLAIFEGEPYAGLLQGLQDHTVVVYDVESTGTDTTSDNIIQIAAIRIDQEGKILESFERFIKPAKSVGQSAEVHGFTDEFLAENGEDPAKVLQDFKSFSKGAVIVGHNVNYDVSIFTSELHRHGLGKPEFKAIYDTLDIFRRFYPNLPNHKLGFLSDYFPIDHKPSHNAMDDILATALLLVYAVEHNIRPTEDIRMALINSYKGAFAGLASQMMTLRRKAQVEKPSDLLAYIMKDMGILAYYQERHEGPRVERIRDLYRILVDLDQDYASVGSRDRLSLIVQLAALTAGEPVNQGKRKHAIPIITVHQAKGSEFAHLFLAGLNEGTFPSFLAEKEGRLEEEKRLFYVAITRPKEDLTITYIRENERGRSSKPSSFLDYLPQDGDLVKMVQ